MESAPKRPCAPYIFFTREVQKSVAEANPGVKNAEIVSIMAKMWKETAEEDRVKYIELAAADKIRYEEEMKVLDAKHPENKTFVVVSSDNEVVLVTTDFSEVATLIDGWAEDDLQADAETIPNFRMEEDLLDVYIETLLDEDHGTYRIYETVYGKQTTCAMTYDEYVSQKNE